jgi:hypothetical protein
MPSAHVPETVREEIAINQRMRIPTRICRRVDCSGDPTKEGACACIGPELTQQHGVPNVLADPTLELHNNTGALIASNGNWQTTVIGRVHDES